MKLLTLTCQQCGAPLEVRANVQQFRCLFCGSSVHVQWVDSAGQPKASDSADHRYSAPVKSPEQLRIETEIAQLDDEWKRTRARFMIPGHDGQLSVPDKNKILAASTAGGLAGIAAIAAGVASFMENQSLYPGEMPMNRLLMIVLGAGMIAVMVVWHRIACRRADDFEVHQQQYHAERSKLLAELRENCRDAETRSPVGRG